MKKSFGIAAMLLALAACNKIETNVQPVENNEGITITATGGSNLYAASKASVSFDATKYYQSTVKMGKVIEVFDEDEPFSCNN